MLNQPGATALHRYQLQSSVLPRELLQRYRWDKRLSESILFWIARMLAAMQQIPSIQSMAKHRIHPLRLNFLLPTL